jgi:carbamoyl-phosphate synthase small subunit
MKAILLLEDGTVFEGTSFGARGQKCGEVVFNTSMTGYQEITTDPSYYEQIITMTYPLIGNYGTNKLDYLKANDVVGLAGIDTRKLVRHIRTQGAMRGIISSTELRIPALVKKLDEYPGLVGRDIVKDVTSTKPYKWNKPVVDVLKPDDRGRKTEDGRRKYKVVAYDFGIKQNILRLLVSQGYDVKVVPAFTSAKDVLAQKPDGVFLSNGPGDPAAVTYAIESTRQLLGKVPIFGICLGHQILGLALGGKTFKLKFGHRGANHPVKNLETGQVEITSQNHGFCVDIDSLKDKDVELTHVNLNDNTLEGFRCKRLGAFCVQYHPESSPGPHDSRYLFRTFTDLMGHWKSPKGR